VSLPLVWVKSKSNHNLVEERWNILRLLDQARTLGPVTGKHSDALFVSDLTGRAGQAVLDWNAAKSRTTRRR
jgi:hypothetical protein